MKKIFSKIYPNRLLHILVKPLDLKKNINEITDHSKLLQCIGLKLQKGKKFDSHKHKKIFQLRMTSRTQESWCVIRGAASVFFYDIDGSFLCKQKLTSGCASFTFEGGHSYEILSNNTLIYEYKNGPYKKINDKHYFK